MGTPSSRLVLVLRPWRQVFISEGTYQNCCVMGTVPDLLQVVSMLWTEGYIEATKDRKSIE
jgi:hypothetical protein